MAKRKATIDPDDALVAEEPRRSSRRKISVKEVVVPDVKEDVPKQPRKKAPASDELNGIKKKTLVKEDSVRQKPPKATASLPAPPQATAPGASGDESTSRQYWLMKAEPESRLEKGHDIKFSIDDLASKTGPEPWDGIRAYPARNNLRAMKNGDLAFFYHSSCKVPAIVGIMEIVAEHTPDLSAHDPSAPYHDPSSQPDNPKWSLVHVAFRQKLQTPITLKELRTFAELRDMQMLKLTRLSVSGVREAEWRFLLAEMERRGDVVDL